SLMLSDPEPDVRAAAAWALQQLGNVDTAPALIAALQDVSYDVRSNAGWALVDIGRRRDSPASNAITTEVIAVLRDGESYDTREMAYQVLLRLGGRDASEAIKKYWDE
ncbi:MAG: HEAT repeat domain-containing protein, partial [Chloroflexota bacterium]